MPTKREHWVEDAKCRGQSVSVFFPVFDLWQNDETRWGLARKICAECTVTKECLNLVIELKDTDDKWGMFGGLTPEERRDLRRRRRNGF